MNLYDITVHILKKKKKIKKINFKRKRVSKPSLNMNTFLIMIFPEFFECTKVSKPDEPVPVVNSVGP